MDGTLIDTHGVIAEQMAGAFTAEGLAAPSSGECREIIGLSLPVAVGRLARSEDMSLIDRLVDGYKALYRQALTVAEHREPLYPGARQALDRLHESEGTLLGIATGKGLAGVNRILALHGIADYFVTLQTPDHNPSKPHPGMLLRAMAETGAAPHEVVMIGDTSFVMELARAARVRAIGVSWGYHQADDLLRAGADILVHAYDELDDAIDRLLER